MERQAGHGTDAIRHARRMIGRLLAALPDARCAVRLWDGSEIVPGASPSFTLVVRDAEALRLLVESGDAARVAEAYVRGLLVVEGDLDAAIDVARSLCAMTRGNSEPLRAEKSAHSPAEDTRDVQAHYDLSNDFFRLFLDERMVYSCAYYSDPDESLERAQERKLDLICRKLRLQPGDRFLDVGCGWGALLEWAAERHRAYGHGITLSENQLLAARETLARAGLRHHVTIEQKHYADLPPNSFGKIASVGMVEHVGASRLPEYFGVMRRALTPGGLLLNHGINVSPGLSATSGGAFIARRVFPGAELVDVSTTLSAMEDAGFEIIDVQALRPHYELTLREWSRRFDAHKEKALALVGPRIVRTWEIYLRGCAHAFSTGEVGVHQILARSTDGKSTWPVPLLREEWS